MSTFAKHDNGKPRVGLVPPAAILACAEALTYGAQKYGAGNWKLCTEPQRYYDALQRHLLAWQSGVVLDKESGLPHMSHALASLSLLVAILEDERKMATELLTREEVTRAMDACTASINTPEKFAAFLNEVTP